MSTPATVCSPCQPSDMEYRSICCHSTRLQSTCCCLCPFDLLDGHNNSLHFRFTWSVSPQPHLLSTLTSSLSSCLPPPPASLHSLSLLSDCIFSEWGRTGSADSSAPRYSSAAYWYILLVPKLLSPKWLTTVIPRGQNKAASIDINPSFELQIQSTPQIYSDNSPWKTASFSLCFLTSQ